MPFPSENVCVVVAAYNEAKVISGVIRELVGAFPAVVVVDDGGSSPTAQRTPAVPVSSLLASNE